MMKKNIFIGSMLLITVVIVGVTILPLGCIDNSDKNGPTIMEVTQENSSETIELGPGDQIRVSLEENPTTGFQWNMSSTDGLNLIDDQYVMDEHEEGMVGVGGTHFWTFEISGTQTQQITAVYKRPWENMTGEEQRFELTVKILITE